MRVEQVRGQPLSRGAPFSFEWEGRQITAYPGETILGALIAAGIDTVRTTRFSGEPRGMLCGIGACFECLVTVDGRTSRRACVTPAAPGMVVSSGSGGEGLA